MIEICPKDKCTACSACMNICPKNAISMVECGVMGYVYPQINQDLCIDCHLCEKTCPVNQHVELNNPLKAFAAISKDDDDLMSSTSGGASSVFAQYILNKGGVVYGCVQNNYKDIAHRRIDKIEDAYKLKGSKYVQSNIGYIYRHVKQDLRKGVPVLFTGTPCQIAGLRNYLKKSYDNLYLVDLVCHGVPSQKLLQENIAGMLGDSKCTPCVAFRKKGSKPEDLKFGVFLDRGEVPIKKQIFPNNDYIAAFMAGVIFRKNCFTCQYGQSKRVGDVTIADFWGLDEKSSVPIGKGISLMLANTTKGCDLVDSVSNLCLMEERPIEEAVKGNGQLRKPSIEPDYRDDFIELFSKDKLKAYSRYLQEYRHTYKKNQLRYKIIKFLNNHKNTYSILKRVKKALIK